MKDEGRGMKWFCSGLCVLIFFILHPSSLILAQDEPPPKKAGVQLMFIPPPMEGTVSLGIYDAAGKLVRVLHAESPQTEFTAALNGLITFWDGKDDAGKMMPAGKYRALGYVVGAMDFEGVAFLGNDWITDGNSPRIRRIKAVHALNYKANATLSIELADAKMIDVKSDDQAKIEIPTKNELLNASTPASLDGADHSAEKFKRLPPYQKRTLTIHDGKVVLFDIFANPTQQAIDLPMLSNPIDVCFGRTNETLWVIDRMENGSTEIKQYSVKGEFLRRLSIGESEPQPQKIDASESAELIFLIEENSTTQRFRALELAQVNDPKTANNQQTSKWKVVFSKTITFSDTLDAVRDLLKFPGGQPFVAQEKIALRLLPNPLEQDKPGAVDISIAVDAKGSFLKAGDGLPLCRVSETPNLRWAAMAREPDSKAITIFQSDGAVVEQFKASKLANMMSFDCGDFDFDPAKLK